MEQDKSYRINFWDDEKVQVYFNKLLEHSSVTSIDWKKFRRLDNKNKKLFEKVTNNHLGVIYLRKKRILAGICIKCGTNKSVTKNLCNNCLSKTIKAIK